MDERTLAAVESLVVSLKTILSAELRTALFYEGGRDASFGLAAFTCGCIFKLYPAESPIDSLSARGARACGGHSPNPEQGRAWLSVEVPWQRFDGEVASVCEENSVILLTNTEVVQLGLAFRPREWPR